MKQSELRILLLHHQPRILPIMHSFKLLMIIPLLNDSVIKSLTLFENLLLLLGQIHDQQLAMNSLLLKFSQGLDEESVVRKYSGKKKNKKTK